MTCPTNPSPLALDFRRSAPLASMFDDPKELGRIYYSGTNPDADRADDALLSLMPPTPYR